MVVSVLCLYLAMSSVVLWSVIVVFPGQTYLLFGLKSLLQQDIPEVVFNGYLQAVYNFIKIVGNTSFQACSIQKIIKLYERV